MVYNLRSIGQSLIKKQDYCPRRGTAKICTDETQAISGLDNILVEMVASGVNQSQHFKQSSHPVISTNQIHHSSNSNSCCSTQKDVNHGANKPLCQDFSNNSNTDIRSKCSSKNAILDESQSVCPVLNCEARFSDVDLLERHMKMFEHLPCNPCLKAIDCKLSPSPLFYVCPMCETEIFWSKDSCRRHQEAMSHCLYLPPLAIIGYMCGQCFQIFDNFYKCQEHMEKLSHYDLQYPFKGDFSNRPDPVPVVEELVQDLISKCKKVPHRVQCLECSMELTTAAELDQHRQETNNQHVVYAFTDSTISDVFAGYLAGYMCDTCKRLFSGDLKELAKHQCAQGVMGTIVENNIISFAKFVKHCALTLVKSLDVNIKTRSRSPKAGTSRDVSCSRGDTQGRQGAYSTEHTGTTEGKNSNQENTIKKSDKKFQLQIKKKKIEKVVTDDCDPEIEKLFTNDSENVNTIPLLPDTEVTALSTRSSSTQIHGTKTLGSSKQVPGSSLANPVIKSPQINTRSPGHHHSSASGSTHDISTGQSTSQDRARHTLHVEEQQVNKRNRSRSPLDSSPISTDNLKKMDIIIFLDYDNWPSFFAKLPRRLPDKTFVWAFYGGRSVWREPNRSQAYLYARSKSLFYLNERCGTTKDAADFAIVLNVGKMDERLPTNIAFVIMSGDKGFCEVERQMKSSKRKAVVIDPHSAESFSSDIIFTMVSSINNK